MRRLASRQELRTRAAAAKENHSTKVLVEAPYRISRGPAKKEDSESTGVPWLGAGLGPWRVS